METLLAAAAAVTVVAGSGLVPTVPCTTEQLSGDWLIVERKADGANGTYFCGLGLDPSGRIVWSLCKDQLFPNVWFGIDGSFSIRDAFSISGSVDDGMFDFEVTARYSSCGPHHIEGPIEGTVAPTSLPGWAAWKLVKGASAVTFVGTRLDENDVDRLSRSYTENRPFALPAAD